MLVKSAILERIEKGEITLIFRRWKRAGVKAGGTQLTQRGLLAIDAVDIVTLDQITDADARDAGFADRGTLIADLYDRDEDIYKIRVHYAGDDPRKALRADDDLTETEMSEVVEKLKKMDRTSKRGAWTQAYLQLIQDMPATYSGLLANYLGINQAEFKPWVRKLKALGLTESLEVGYKLSPRGEKVLAALQERRQ